MSISQNILFLSMEEIVLINKQYAILFGGMHGIRDFGLLDAAIKRPQASFNGAFLYDNIYSMAAVYAPGIIKNHPFIDGNKRTGMAASLIFLESNDYEVLLSNEDIYNIGIALATSEISYDILARIFEDNVLKKREKEKSNTYRH